MCQVSDENWCLEDSIFPVSLLLNASKLNYLEEKKK